MSDANEFHAWLKATGIRRITDAATALGLGQRTTFAISAGARDLTTTERLAMTAVYHGMQPWPNGADEPLAIAPPPEAEPEPSIPKARRFHHQTIKGYRGARLRRRNRGVTDA